MQLNKIFFCGRLTREPELSYLPSQTAVVKIGMANSRKYKGADGQMKEDKCFVTCVAFGKSAETLQKYVHKGDELLVEGRLSYSSWEKDGQKRNKLEISIDNFQFGAKVNRDTSQGQQQDLYNNNAPMPMDDQIPF